MLSPSRRRDLAPRGSPSSARRRALRPGSASRAGTFPPASCRGSVIQLIRFRAQHRARDGEGDNARERKVKRVSGRQQPCRRYEGPGRTAWLPWQVAQAKFRSVRPPSRSLVRIDSRAMREKKSRRLFGSASRRSCSRLQSRRQIGSFQRTPKELEREMRSWNE